ncbi:hypothetical protein QJS04_geneDACA004717 [Acorus gramineus]|uniref:Uncharacterized protein n=1 Tax=Acorus gramineus TaxID=55184 RepID=A0AAV9BWG6_ACOGR|nr:hypothetical protein QJS04_geneDACA004717 [Acorus gramineus]
MEAVVSGGIKNLFSLVRGVFSIEMSFVADYDMLNLPSWMSGKLLWPAIAIARAQLYEIKKTTL